MTREVPSALSRIRTQTRRCGMKKTRQLPSTSSAEPSQTTQEPLSCLTVRPVYWRLRS